MKPCIIGGAYPEFAMLDASTDLKLTDRKHLASITVSTILKRLDTRGDCYQVQLTPRHRSGGTALHEFKELGEIANACSFLAFSCYLV